MRRIVLALVVLAGCDIRNLSVSGDAGNLSIDSGAGGRDASGGSGGMDGAPDGAGDSGPDACVPTAEVCNGLDDDCDGVVDNGFDLATDPNNCGQCNHVCQFTNATALCAGGQCALGACAFGHGDANHDPSDGCECSFTNGGVEICNGVDDDCNGIIDDGFDLQTDAANCGQCGHRCNFQNAVGACTSGQCRLDHCLPNFYDIDGDPANGCEYGCLVSNGGVEICDGLDNDCNGSIDDNPIDAGQPCFPFGTGCTRNANGTYSCVGACRAGTTTCQGGFLQCLGFVGPSAEICDNLDNDCNGVVDDPFNKQTDPLHCGGCNPCNIPNAVAACTNGTCAIAECRPGFFNVDGNLANGCEYACNFTGPEVCDGVDNNCDGRIDEGFNKQTDPNNCGASCTRCQFAHATALCASGACAMGACDPGFVNLDGLSSNGCEYACTVTSQTEICNGVDDNCNGQIDEGFNLLTDANNCGQCGHRCSFNHAAGLCVNGTCQMGACDAGFVNLNGQTADGCEYQCTVSNGGVEICDGRDNNCNGQIDEGSPGAGQPCLPGVPMNQWNNPPCSPGTTACVNGNLVCQNFTGPQAEICDGQDNDCNGVVDDPFNKQSDPNNCGSCGHVCQNDFTAQSPHAVAGCSSGMCVIAACDAGYYNLNNNYADGCEYHCPTGTPGSAEVCDGVDNDCDGLVDGADVHTCTSDATCPQVANGEVCLIGKCSVTHTTSCALDSQCPGQETCVFNKCSFDLLPLKNFCAQLGACAGAAPSCRTVTIGGTPTTEWVCNYGANVQTTGPNQIIGNETLCDGIDNDCDGCVDEPFPPAGHPAGTSCAALAPEVCTDGGVGACQGTGHFVCNGTHDGVECTITTPGITPTSEVCDGIDNDCDGLVDESWDDPAGTTRCPGNTRCLGVRPSTALAGATVVAQFEAARPDSNRPVACTSNAQCTGGTQCDTAAGACEKPCTTPTDCPSGTCVAASGGSSGFCLPAEGQISPTACTANSQCASGACVMIQGASSCTDAGGQPQCFCLPGQGGQSPLACSLAGAEPWNSVTFAQAQFACQLAGMRLCTAAEWTAACGAQTYPYGASYQANTCNGHDFDADSLVGGDQDQPVPTGKLATCVQSGIFDLSGNVAEWTNDLRTTLADGRKVYTLRGGAYDNGAGGLACAFTATVVPEDFSFPNTGFRCCSASCAAGQADCGAAGCKDLGTDNAHCGFCGHACAGGTSCHNGICR